jgi:hypothetical protein
LREFRDRFRNTDFFSRRWFERHPRAWFIGAPWIPFSWAAYGNWFGIVSPEPVFFDYGNNIYYSGDTVYVNDEPVGSAEQYYDSVRSMAAAGEVALSPDDQWMPLGVFAIATPDGQSDSQGVFQFAVDKQGILRGNYIDQSTDAATPIQGTVDQRGQRAAWTVGDDWQTVYETGVYNLSRDEAPMLVHFGADHNEQWTLIRLNQPVQ